MFCFFFCVSLLFFFASFYLLYKKKKRRILLVISRRRNPRLLCSDRIGQETLALVNTYKPIAKWQKEAEESVELSGVALVEDPTVAQEEGVVAAERKKRNGCP